jgi:uncharacterized protein (TIGR02452 family)
MRDHNKYYWEGKQQRADQAKRHTDLMEKYYRPAINQAVHNTKIYTGPLNVGDNTSTKTNVTMEIVRADSVSALFEHVQNDGRIAMLNFASYKHPGGGFMVGSRAQEESLCHESFLYNVLKEFDETYYESNRKDLNRGLYRDRALYSPDIFFIRNKRGRKCDVITCASPNFSVAEKHVGREYNNNLMRERVRFVLEVAKLNNVNTFIVGAWGCGGATRC